MSDQISLEQIEIAELTQATDDARLPGDKFKLPVDLRELLDVRLANHKAKLFATSTSEGGRAMASKSVREALDQLLKLLRDRYNFVQGIGSDAERLGVFISYGWESGLVGEFTDARVEMLANQAIAVTPSISNPAHRYPEALLTLISATLAIVNANQPRATGGEAQVAVDEKDDSLELLQRINSRMRFYYCSASDDIDQTPELTKIGRQARRDQGAAATQPLPGSMGTVTFDPVAKTLAADSLPEHATSARAYRRAAGGNANSPEPRTPRPSQIPPSAH